MDLRSSTRSRRSKSRTPFATAESEQVYIEEKYTAVTHSEDIRTSSTVVRSSNGKSSYERLSGELSIKSSDTKPSGNRRTRRFSKLYKTSDYSSEDGENEVSSTRSISDNERNRLLEDARKASDNSTGITALGLYRKAKQYWEEYPKTDWTYSPFSKDRVEIAPGVVAMPNMSRRHISSYDKYTNTNTYSASSPSSFLRTRQILETNSFYSVVKTNILRVLISIFSIVHLFWRPFSYVFRLIHSVSITVAKGIYMGTSAIMLLDTWLLRSNRNYSKAAALTALCLIPFLLIGDNGSENPKELKNMIHLRCLLNYVQEKKVLWLLRTRILRFRQNQRQQLSEHKITFHSIDTTEDLSNCGRPNHRYTN